MSFQCDGCGNRMETWGVSFLMATDHHDDQPDFPPETDHMSGHLCVDCRERLRQEFGLG